MGHSDLFRDHLAEMMKDPEFAEEWEKDAEEYELRRALLDARVERHLTQRELAERSGVNSRVISRIELGDSIPSLRTLRKLAHGLGCTLSVSFVPDSAAS